MVLTKEILYFDELLMIYPSQVHYQWLDWSCLLHLTMSTLKSGGSLEYRVWPLRLFSKGTAALSGTTPLTDYICLARRRDITARHWHLESLHGGLFALPRRSPETGPTQGKTCAQSPAVARSIVNVPSSTLIGMSVRELGVVDYICIHSS